MCDKYSYLQFWMRNYKYDYQDYFHYHLISLTIKYCDSIYGSDKMSMETTNFAIKIDSHFLFEEFVIVTIVILINVLGLLINFLISSSKINKDGMFNLKEGFQKMFHYSHCC